MPGETGKVPVQLDSTHQNGQVFKTISVTSNDKQKPVVVLQLKGNVWKPLEILPQYAVLSVPPDATNAELVGAITGATSNSVSRRVERRAAAQTQL